MSDMMRRAWRPFTDIEARADGDGRTITGIAVPFDEPTPIREMGREFVEVFRRGSFTQTINGGVERVKLLLSHDRHTLAVGKAVGLREDPAGLVGEFRVSDTADGRDALTLVRDGVIDAFSIGFVPVRDQWNADETFVERLEVKLSEVSLVNFPAFDGARITGVRSLFGHFDGHADPDAGHLAGGDADSPHPDPDAQAQVGAAVNHDRERARIRARLRAKGYLTR